MTENSDIWPAGNAGERVQRRGRTRLFPQVIGKTLIIQPQHHLVFQRTSRELRRQLVIHGISIQRRIGAAVPTVQLAAVGVPANLVNLLQLYVGVGVAGVLTE
ncbi:hypothetical protein D3C80_1668130 [compost metagenome]